MQLIQYINKKIRRLLNQQTNSNYKTAIQKDLTALKIKQLSNQNVDTQKCVGRFTIPNTKKKQNIYKVNKTLKNNL